jgi:phospholipase C
MKSRFLPLALALCAVSCAVSCGGSSGATDDTVVDDTGGSADETSTGDETGGTGDDTGGSGDDSTVGDTGGTASDGAPSDGTGSDATGDSDPLASNHIKYVWIIVEENHNWSSIKGASSTPYINSLLTDYAHAEKYSDRGLHPSEPNYIWMEAGDNLGITNDSDPKSNSQKTTNHLTTKLEAAGVSWKSWQEDMPSDTKCPLSSSGNYGAKHNPMVFFQDVTDNNDSASKHCIAHMGSTKTLESDLAAGKVPHYNFISPNLCNDMHGATLCPFNLEKKGDDWLKALVPKIQATKEYKDAGVIFIVWDEGTGGTSNIGLIAISPFAKKGFSDTTNTYSHSSLLRTVQTIFGVTPFIRDADKAKDLGNLFTAFP